MLEEPIVAHHQELSAEKPREALEAVLEISGFTIGQRVVLPAARTRELKRPAAGMIGKISGVGTIEQHGRLLPAIEVTYDGKWESINYKDLILWHELVRFNPVPEDTTSDAQQALSLEQRMNHGPFQADFVRKHTYGQESFLYTASPTYLAAAIKELEAMTQGLTVTQISEEIVSGQRQMYELLLMNLERVIRGLESQVSSYYRPQLDDPGSKYWEGAVIQDCNKQIELEAKRDKLRELLAKSEL